MHNRVRTIVASFLVKDFIWSGSSVTDISCVGCRRRPGLQPARLAVDGGCGTDAAPYFRVFNPSTQGKKFDPSGDHVRRHVRELRHVPTGCRNRGPWPAVRRTGTWRRSSTMVRSAVSRCAGWNGSAAERCLSRWLRGANSW